MRRGTRALVWLFAAGCGLTCIGCHRDELDTASPQAPAAVNGVRTAPHQPVGKRLPRTGDPNGPGPGLVSAGPSAKPPEQK